MEQPYNYIRFLFFLYNLHPPACTRFHFFKMQSAPQLFGQPRRDSRCNHAQNSNLHSLALYYFIRLQVRLPGGIIYDVCTQHGEITLLYPSVIHIMSCLHIMVTHITYHTTHIVHHLCRHMGRERVYKIIIISRGLSLQNITIIYQQAVISIYFALLLYKGMHTCQAPTPILTFYEVIRKEITVYITGFYYLDNHFFFFLISGGK